MKNQTDGQSLSHPRLASELKTIRAMITIYCRAHHGSDRELCRDCSQLLVYAGKRLGLCPFREAKPTCGKCTVHCYRPEMRETIRKVMRYAGPRMLLRHPLMALRHLLDGRKKAPELVRRRKTSTGTEPECPPCPRRNTT